MGSGEELSGCEHHTQVRWESKWKGTLKRRINRDIVSEVYLASA